MPETLQPNEPAARTTDGTLLDQTQTQTTTTPTPTGHEPPTPEPKPIEGAPTEYKFTAPEGHELDAKALEGATAVFKELGLTQDQAQKLVEWGIGREAEVGKRSAEVYDTMRANWRTQSEEYLNSNYEGGKDAALAEINKALQLLPPKLQTEFKDNMTLTGAGDNLAVIRTFLEFARLINEGQHVSGAGPSELGQAKPGTTARPSQAQAMYPTLPSSSTAH